MQVIKELKSISFKTWLASGASIVLFLILYCVIPYDNGYLDEKQTILTWVYHGYTVIENGEWGFGFMVLPASIAMLWFTRDRLKDIVTDPSWWGLLIILVAMVLYLAGFKANQKFIGFFSGHILIAGMVIWLTGWKCFYKVLWLWMFLGMMWPLTPLIDYISFPLRKIVTTLTVFLWNTLGIDVVQNGTAILSAGEGELQEGEKFRLAIAAACSGLRSLFALVMISLLFAYVGVKEEWKRLVVVLAMFPIAIFANVVRISLLLVGTIFWGNDFAIGTDASPSGYHLGAGFVVYIISLFCMLFLVTLLNKGSLKLFKRRSLVVKRKVVEE